ncbi:MULTISPECIES: DUF190 domain-containing protein [Streptomyces]|uniref:DUF190 domain-containing protein n=1 Tax=Streptomyces morookaense TaxID=1970 RepID=A0A7Y7E7B4_STRMO|nr:MULTISPECIES: DUF190 domain-containing protein [Streptomyces]MCC2279279.1 DUF190 domain-containing protein [Streptomyces sp. ET3-23]NVK78226.1 DUF190 domain-containing protein [Streptomyces morookaense]GHF31292.1 hypothetical protein GCM10010359_36920 [Streptomyces morookaense]
MGLNGPAIRATVFLSEGDTWQGRPLHDEIIRRAQQRGLAGATLSRGTEGFGRPSALHTDRLLSFSDGLPLVITMIDVEDRLRSFLAGAEHLLSGCLVVLDEVDAFRIGGAGDG